MISYDEALALVCEQARPLGKGTLAVAAAHRRILAEPVIARLDSPPADVSAMDGYAVRDSEIAAGRTEFEVVGESFPGAGFGGKPGPGQCVRIFTGGPLPEDLDRVIVQEVVRREGAAAIVEGKPASARHVRKRGSDFSRGALLLESGRLLDARALVAAAGADNATVTVWKPPRIAVLSTGDELVAPGEATRQAEQAAAHSATPLPLRESSALVIPESLSPGIAALTHDWGGTVVGRYRSGDRPGEIEVMAGEGLEGADVLVVTGGASVGEKDFAKSVLMGLGLELIFSTVAIKPGKPVWFGRVGDRLVLGLPGNPTSALVTARLLLAPLVTGLSGRTPRSALKWRTAPLKEGLGPGGDRETFVRGRWSGKEAQPLADQDSGAQKALADAELLIRRRPGAAAAEPGTPVEVLDF